MKKKIALLIILVISPFVSIEPHQRTAAAQQLLRGTPNNGVAAGIRAGSDAARPYVNDMLGGATTHGRNNRGDQEMVPYTIAPVDAPRVMMVPPPSLRDQTLTDLPQTLAICPPPRTVREKLVVGEALIGVANTSNDKIFLRIDELDDKIVTLAPNEIKILKPTQTKPKIVAHYNINSPDQQIELLTGRVNYLAPAKDLSTLVSSTP